MAAIRLQKPWRACGPRAELELGVPRGPAPTKKRGEHKVRPYNSLSSFRRKPEPRYRQTGYRPAPA